MAGVNDIGIDLGSSHVLIYMKGKGIILREASVVAIDRDSREIIAFGEEASRMIGRTPGNILALRPLRDGSITDYELVSFMLKGFVMKAIGKHMFARPRAILAVPSAVNEMERRSLISTMFDAGMRRTQLLNRSLAAALGALTPKLEQLFVIKKRDIQPILDYNEKEMKLDAQLVLTITIGRAICLALRALVRLLKLWLNKKKAVSNT